MRRLIKNDRLAEFLKVSFIPQKLEKHNYTYFTLLKGIFNFSKHFMIRLTHFLFSKPI